MDFDEAVEAAEEFYGDDFVVEIDGKSVMLALRKVQSDEGVVTVRFAVDRVLLPDGEPSEDLRGALERSVDDFREAFPELVRLAVEFDFVAAG